MRPRLHALLDRGVQSTLTLVSAPAGFGKTTLLADWGRTPAEARSIRWVALDADDNGRARLLQSISTALDELLVPPAPTRRLRRRRIPPGAWPTLLNSIGARPEPVVLVLDDVHLLHAPAVIGDLTHLVRDAPENLRIVLSTRSDPALPLERYRLWGRLTDIRAADLAMTSDETRVVLGAVGVELEAEDVEALRARTEGWPAAIRLAAISLRSAEDPRRFLADFNADNRAISDYLLTEVVATQPPDLRLFLLRTSIADRLTPELATRLTGRFDAGAVLADLVRNELFVRASDHDPVVYRYHPLFRSFLRAQLARERPQEVRDLHARVAAWSDRDGSPMEWLRHALGAADWEMSARAATAAWPQLACFDAPATTRKLVETVPREAREQHASLALLDALALAGRNELQESRRRVELAGQLPEQPETRAQLDALRAFVHMSLARLDGDLEELALRSQQLLELSSAGRVGGVDERRALRATALCNLGLVALLNRDVDAAEEALEEALEVAQLAQATFACVASLGQLALLEAARGRLRRSAELAHEAVDLATRHGWAGSLHTVTAQLARGWVSFHWAEPVLAEGYLNEAAAVARKSGDRPGKAVSALLSAHCLAAHGQAGAAEALRRLRGTLAEVRGLLVPPLLAGLFAAAMPSLLAARGDLEEARAALDRAPRDHPEVAVVAARLALAQADPEGARRLVEAALEPPASQPGRVEAWLLKALAERGLRERAVAQESLERALQLAAPEHYRSVFLAGGPAARAALVELIRAGTAHRSFVAELIAVFDDRAPSVELTPAEVLEPLSEREKAILRYLPTMMSNVEIAEEVYLSINTVKTHLRHIYRKLGVARRRDAVERARQLSLL
jgi:LuxR family maltose regulon positive regulatory protein